MHNNEATKNLCNRLLKLLHLFLFCSYYSYRNRLHDFRNLKEKVM